MSFAGGGTDLSAFYNEEPGAVLSTGINKYIYITTNRKFDDKVRASYSITEIVDRPSQLRHEIIRECLKLVGIEGGIEITSISDIPSSGTGLGSSSTYTVGLLHALYAHVGRHVGPERLAREACDIEIEILGKPIGKQDQYAAAYGGLQYYQFNPDGTVFVDPVICPPRVRDRLESHLLMLYTGLTRSADGILAEQGKNTVSDATKRDALRRMRHQAAETRTAIQSERIDDIGHILHEAWELKKSLASRISTPDIDHWYDLARKAGAIGGKILGAGGGGFLLLYAPPERHDAICQQLPELKVTPFAMEPQGSKIIFVEEAPH